MNLSIPTPTYPHQTLPAGGDPDRSPTLPPEKVRPGGASTGDRADISHPIESQTPAKEKLPWWHWKSVTKNIGLTALNIGASVAGGSGGAAAGAAIGATWGTAIPIPIVGTMTGAALGGAIGWFVGSAAAGAGMSALTQKIDTGKIDGGQVLIDGVTGAVPIPGVGNLAVKGASSVGFKVLQEGAEGLASVAVKKAISEGAEGAVQGAIQGGATSVYQQSKEGGKISLGRVTTDTLSGAVGGAVGGAVIGGVIGGVGHISKAPKTSAVELTTGSPEVSLVENPEAPPVENTEVPPVESTEVPSVENPEVLPVENTENSSGDMGHPESDRKVEEPLFQDTSRNEPYPVAVITPLDYSSFTHFDADLLAEVMEKKERSLEEIILIALQIEEDSVNLLKELQDAEKKNINLKDSEELRRRLYEFVGRDMYPSGFSKQAPYDLMSDGKITTILLRSLLDDTLKITNWIKLNRAAILKGLLPEPESHDKILRPLIIFPNAGIARPPSWAEMAGIDPSTPVNSFHGGGWWYLQGLLLGENGGYPLENNGYGIQIHPSLTKEGFLVRSDRVRYYAERASLTRFDYPATLEFVAPAGVLDSAPNQYEAGFRPEFLPQATDFTLTNLEAGEAIMAATYDELKEKIHKASKLYQLDDPWNFPKIQAEDAQNPNSLKFGNGFWIEDTPSGQGLFTESGGFVFTPKFAGIEMELREGWVPVYKPHFTPVIEGVQFDSHTKAATFPQKLKVKLAFMSALLEYVEEIKLGNFPPDSALKLSFSHTTPGFYNLLLKIGFSDIKLKDGERFAVIKASDLVQQEPDIRIYAAEYQKKLDRE